MPNWRFVEFGKYYGSGGVSDFFELVATPSEQGKARSYGGLLQLLEQGEFARRAEAVTAALVQTGPSEYLFAHIQRRRENALDPQARTARFFYQIRYSKLSQGEILQLLKSGSAPFAELFLRKPAWLKDSYQRRSSSLPTLPFYAGIVGTQTPERLGQTEPNLLKQRSLLYSLHSERSFDAVNTRYHLWIRHMAEALIKDPRPIQVVLPRHDFDPETWVVTKLKLVQAVQRIVAPKLGPITFALDYVMDTHYRSVRLQLLDQGSLERASINGSMSTLDLTRVQNDVPSDSYSYCVFETFRTNEWKIANAVIFDFADLLLAGEYREFLNLVRNHQNNPRAAARILIGVACRSWESANHSGSISIKPEQWRRLEREDWMLLLREYPKCVLSASSQVLSQEDWLLNFAELDENVIRPEYVELFLNVLASSPQNTDWRNIGRRYASKGGSLRQLYETRRTTVGLPTLNSLSSPSLVHAMISLSIGAAERDPHFAEWFLVNELIYADRLPAEELCRHARILLTEAAKSPHGQIGASLKTVNRDGTNQTSLQRLLGDKPIVALCAIDWEIEQGVPVSPTDLDYLIQMAESSQMAQDALLKIVQSERPSYRKLPDETVSRWVQLYLRQPARYRDNSRDYFYEFLKRLREVDLGTVTKGLLLSTQLSETSLDYDVEREYVYWLNLGAKKENRQPSAMAYLAGRGEGFKSIWEAVNTISPDDLHLYQAAIDHRVRSPSRINVFLTNQEVLTLYSLARREDGKPFRDSLTSAIKNGWVSPNLVKELLENRGGQDSGQVTRLLEGIAGNAFWSRGISEAAALAWLQAYPSSKRQRLSQANERDKIYDIGATVYDQDAELLWQLICETASLPDAYDQRSEYGRWILDAQEKRVTFGKEIPDQLKFLLSQQSSTKSYLAATRCGENPDGLFLLAVGHATRHRSRGAPLAEEDILHLLQLAQSDSQARVMLSQVAERSDDLVPEAFVPALIGAFDHQVLTILVADPSWRKYIASHLSEESMAAWVQRAAIGPYMDYQKGESDYLFSLSLKILRSYPELFRQLVYYTSLLPGEASQLEGFLRLKQILEESPQLQRRVTDDISCLMGIQLNCSAYRASQGAWDQDTIFLLALAAELRSGESRVLGVEDVRALVALASQTGVSRADRILREAASRGKIDKAYVQEVLRRGGADLQALSETPQLTVITDLDYATLQEYLKSYRNKPQKEVSLFFAMLKQAPSLQEEQILLIINSLPNFYQTRQRRGREFLKVYEYWISRLSSLGPESAEARLLTEGYGGRVATSSPYADYFSDAQVLFLAALHYAKKKRWKVLEGDIEHYYSLRRSDPFGKLRFIDYRQLAGSTVRPILVVVLIGILLLGYTRTIRPKQEQITQGLGVLVSTSATAISEIFTGDLDEIAANPPGDGGAAGGSADGLVGETSPPDDSVFGPAAAPVETSSPTATLEPTLTFTPTPVPSATPSLTPTPTSTFTPTLTPTPTSTFTPTLTPTPTLTFTPTSTFTPSPTPAPTDTPSPTPTPSPTQPPTITPTPEPVELAFERGSWQVNWGGLAYSSVITSPETSLVGDLGSSTIRLIDENGERELSPGDAAYANTSPWYYPQVKQLYFLSRRDDTDEDGAITNRDRAALYLLRSGPNAERAMDDSYAHMSLEAIDNSRLASLCEGGNLCILDLRVYSQTPYHLVLSEEGGRLVSGVSESDIDSNMVPLVDLVQNHERAGSIFLATEDKLYQTDILFNSSAPFSVRPMEDFEYFTLENGQILGIAVAITESKVVAVAASLLEEGNRIYVLGPDGRMIPPYGVPFPIDKIRQIEWAIPGETLLISATTSTQMIAKGNEIIDCSLGCLFSLSLSPSRLSKPDLQLITDFENGFQDFWVTRSR